MGVLCSMYMNASVRHIKQRQRDLNCEYRLVLVFAYSEADYHKVLG